MEAEGLAAIDKRILAVEQGTDGMTWEEEQHSPSVNSGTNSTAPTVDTVLYYVTHDDVTTTAATGEGDALASLATPQKSKHRVKDSDTLTIPIANEVRARLESRIQVPPATQVATTGVAPLERSRSSEDLPLILCSLSIDSLHYIASFLAPIDWASFSLSSKATNRVGNEVFRRVRMHGFRCATEVVAAWKLGQLADARELSALYIRMGVPIYPHSLGHSYHTLTWRMGIESREMETSRESAQGSTEEPQSDEISSNRVIDRFYSERYDTEMNDRSMYLDLTYLEQKCEFWYRLKSESGEGGSAINGRTSFILPPPILQARGHAPANGVGIPARFPDFRPAATDQSRERQRGGAGPSVSPSLSEWKLPRTPRLVIPVHRHLVDQHLLGRPIVDDKDGAMQTAPVSLSADFFHPYIAWLKSSSSKVPSSEVAGANKELPARANQQHGDLSHSMTSSGRIVPPTSTPPPPGNGMPNAAAIQSVGSDAANDGNHSDGDGSDQGMLGFGSTVHTPTHLESPLLTPPPLVCHSAVFETPLRIEHPDLANVDFDIYSSASVTRSQIPGPADAKHEIRDRLRTRFAAYQCRLDLALIDRDNQAVDECILDFWDEFLPATANIHFYDRCTAVPRVSCLQKFLTNPCPKAIGIVQCEIERVRVLSKKKGVNMKGRLFPSYEYRLFIRDRRGSSGAENLTGHSSEEPRKDTVLITAKNRGKKHRDIGDKASISQSSKKGVNNYYLFTPQQSDVDAHYSSVNVAESASTKRPNGPSYAEASTCDDSRSVLLGRLQSNFIGTEFQIFSQTLQKRQARIASTRCFLPTPTSIAPASDNENDLDYDSGVSDDIQSTSPTSQRRKSFRLPSTKSVLNRRSDSSIDHPRQVEEETPSRPTSLAGRRSLRRTVLLPGTYSRSSRKSRRAIAHAIEPAEPQLFQPTYLCEREEGAITYTANLLGNRPRIMDVCIPKVSSDGVAADEWKRYLELCSEENDGGSANTMLTCFKQLQQRLENPNHQHDENASNGDNEDVAPDDYGLLALQNRPPWWNIELGAFVLNFGGRVSVASVKNFQLCDRSNQDHIMLQFGRIHGRHSFTMDFQHPLTAVQAFAIAISSLQSKISFG